jgi:hypothetical protein
MWKGIPLKVGFPCNYRNVHCSQREYLTGRAGKCSEKRFQRFRTRSNLWLLLLMAFHAVAAQDDGSVWLEGRSGKRIFKYNLPFAVFEEE